MEKLRKFNIKLPNMGNGNLERLYLNLRKKSIHGLKNTRRCVLNNPIVIISYQFEYMRKTKFDKRIYDPKITKSLCTLPLCVYNYSHKCTYIQT